MKCMVCCVLFHGPDGTWSAHRICISGTKVTARYTTGQELPCGATHTPRLPDAVGGPCSTTVERKEKTLARLLFSLELQPYAH